MFMIYYRGMEYIDIQVFNLLVETLLLIDSFVNLSTRKNLGIVTTTNNLLQQHD